MELIDIIPEFNLYEEYWKIYTKSDIIPPQFISEQSKIERSIIGEGTEVYGEVINSVIGAGVTIGEGAVIRDSIIMKGTTIGAGTVVDKAIVAEDVTIGERSVIPDGVKIGRNTAISGVTTAEDYHGGELESGDYIIKAGGIQ